MTRRLLLAVNVVAVLGLGLCSVQLPRYRYLGAPLHELVLRYFDADTLLVVSLGRPNAERDVNGSFAGDSDAEHLEFGRYRVRRTVDAVLDAVSVDSRPVVVLADMPEEVPQHAAAYLGSRAHGFLLMALGEAPFDGVRDRLTMLRHLPWWNSTARFLVVTVAPHPELILLEMHDEFIEDVALLIPGQVPGGDGAEVLASAYGCGSRLTAVRRVLRWNGGRFNGGNPFPPRTPLWGMRCRPVVRASINNNESYFAEYMAHEVIRSLPGEIVPDVFPSSSIFNTMLPNGTWGGLLGHVQRREADMGLFLMPNSERMWHFRQSLMVTTTQVYAYVRCSSSMPAAPRAGLLHLFSHRSLVELMVAVMLAYFACAALGRWLNEHPWHPARAPTASYSRGFFEVYAILIEQPIEPRFPAQRPVFGLMLVFVLVLNVFLKSVITADLTRSPWAGQVRTLVDLSRRGTDLGVVAPIVLANVRRAADEVPELRGLAQRSHLCTFNISDCFHRLKSDRSASYALAGSQLSPWRKMLVQSKTCAYRVPEVLETAQLMIYTRKDDPLGEMVDDVLQRLQNGGLPRYWLNLMHPKGVYTARRGRESDSEDSDGQLAMATAVLSFGHLLAVLVFLAELMAAGGPWPHRWKGRGRGVGLGVVDVTPAPRPRRHPPRRAPGAQGLAARARPPPPGARLQIGRPMIDGFLLAISDKAVESWTLQCR